MNPAWNDAPPPPPVREAPAQLVPEVVEPLHADHPLPVAVPMQAAQPTNNDSVDELTKLVNYLKYKGVIGGDWDTFDGRQGPGRRPDVAERVAQGLDAALNPEAARDGDEDASSTAGSQATSRRSEGNPSSATGNETGTASRAASSVGSWGAARVDPPETFDLASNASERSGHTDASTTWSWNAPAAYEGPGGS